MAGKTRTPFDFGKQFAKIGLEATKQYLVDDYSSNVSQLVSDAKTIGETLSNGKTKVTDVVNDIRQNGGKKFTDWFFTNGDMFGDSSLTDDDSDFDAGFQIGDDSGGDKDNPEESPSQVLDSNSMKDIARGQASVMYQIAGKQAEASMLNAAEVTSSINGRASEIITSLNNMNKGIMDISQKLDTIIKLQGATLQEQEEANANKGDGRNGIFNADGSVTLGSAFGHIQDQAKELGSWLSMLSSVKDMGPSAVLAMGLEMTGLKEKKFGDSKLGGFVADKLGGIMNKAFGVDNMKDSSWDSIGKQFNENFGNAVSQYLTKAFTSTGWIDKIFDKIGGDDALGLRDSVKNMFSSSAGTRHKGAVDYRSEAKSEYNRETAKFDGMVRTTIVEVIPDYLKIIAGALTGKEYSVNTKGHVSTKKVSSEELQGMRDISAFSGNIIGNTVGSKVTTQMLTSSGYTDADKKGLEKELSGNTRKEADEMFTYTIMKYFYFKRIRATAPIFESEGFWTEFRQMYDENVDKSSNQVLKSWKTQKFGNGDQTILDAYFEILRRTYNENDGRIFGVPVRNNVEKLCKSINSRIEQQQKADKIHGEKMHDLGFGEEARALTAEDAFRIKESHKDDRKTYSAFEEAQEALKKKTYQEQVAAGKSEKKNKKINKGKSQADISTEKAMADYLVQEGDAFSKLGKDFVGKTLEEVEKILSDKLQGGLSSETDRDHSLGTEVKGMRMSGISENFQDQLFNRLDTIIGIISKGQTPTEIPDLGNLFKMPKEAEETTGSGDEPQQTQSYPGGTQTDDDSVSQQDEQSAAMVQTMINAASQDGTLKEDVGRIRQLINMIKNNKLKTKLQQMFTRFTNGEKNADQNKEDDSKGGGGFLSKIKGMFGGGLLGVVGGAIKSVGKLFITAIAQPFINLVKKGLTAGWNNVREGFKELTDPENLKKMGESLKSGFQKIKEGGGKIGGAIKKVTGTSMEFDEYGHRVKGTGSGLAGAASYMLGQSATFNDDGSVAKDANGKKSGSGIVGMTSRLIGQRATGTDENGNKTGGSGILGAVSKSKTLGKVGSVLGKIGGAVSSLPGMAKILGGLAQMVGTIILSMGAVKTLMNLVQKTLSTGLKPLNKGLSKIVKNLKPLLKTIGSVLGKVADAVSKILGTLSGLVGSLSKIISTLLDGVFKLLEPLLTAVTSILGIVTGILEPIFELLNGVLTPILETLGSLVQTVADVITAVLEPILSLLGNILTPFLPIIDTIVDLIINSGPFMWAIQGVMYLIEEVVVPAVQIISGGVQKLAGYLMKGMGKIEALFGELLLGVGEIVKKLTLGAGGKSLIESGNKLIDAGNQTYEQGAGQVDSGQEAIESGMDNFLGSARGTKRSDTNSSEANSAPSGSLPTPIASTGASIDTFGSGDEDTEQTSTINSEGSGIDMTGGGGGSIKELVDIVVAHLDPIAHILLNILKPVASVLEPLFKFWTGIMEPISKVIGSFYEMFGKVSKSLFTPLTSTVKNIVGNKIKESVNIAKQAMGAMETIGANILSGMGMILGAMGQQAAGNALYQTAAGIAMAGIVSSSEGVQAQANRVSKQLTGNNFYMSSLYSDEEVSGSAAPSWGAPISTYTEDQPQIDDNGEPISTDDQPSTVNSDNPTTETPTETPKEEPEKQETPSEPTPTPSVPSVPTSEAIWGDVYGSGNSQGSYGGYLNMSQRGCGPIALADAANRRGGRVSASGLAGRMAASGNYSSSRGTSVGGFLNTAASMGMGYQVGGVTQQSLKRATPNNPVTLVGSGGGFGTRNGNTHYVNVVGTDNSGGAYVSNPLSGRVERRSAGDLAAGSLVGLYGSGDIGGIPSSLFGIYGGAGTTNQNLSANGYLILNTAIWDSEKVALAWQNSKWGSAMKTKSFKYHMLSTNPKNIANIDNCDLTFFEGWSQQKQNEVKGTVASFLNSKKNSKNPRTMAVVCRDNLGNRIIDPDSVYWAMSQIMSAEENLEKKYRNEKNDPFKNDTSTSSTSSSTVSSSSSNVSKTTLNRNKSTKASSVITSAEAAKWLEKIRGSQAGSAGLSDAIDRAYKAYNQKESTHNKTGANTYNLNTWWYKNSLVYWDQFYTEMCQAQHGQPPTFANWYKGLTENGLNSEKGVRWQKVANGIVSGSDKISDDIDTLESEETTEETTESTTSSYAAGSTAATQATSMMMSQTPGGQTGYVSTEMKNSVPSSYDASTAEPIEGSSFFERFKNALGGLTGVLGNLFNIFSSESEDEYADAVEADAQNEKEETTRDILGNEEYEQYEQYAFEMYATEWQMKNPKRANESDEDYSRRMMAGYTDSVKQKYMLRATSDNANVISAMKNNNMIDALNGTSTTMYGDYDPTTGEWSNQLWNAMGAANGTATTANVSSYNDPYAGKFVSDGGAVMWTDKYTPTITSTNITEDGGSSQTNSPIHEFFAKTAGIDINKLADYAFSTNGNWYTKRNDPDTSGVGSSGEEHKGVDVLTSPKSHMVDGSAELHAITGGTVVESRGGAVGSSWNANGGWGNTIAWQDSAGNKHRYAHMVSDPLFKVGDTLSGGEILGHIGSTGQSTGEHVHYQINDASGNTVNPMTYFKYHAPTAGGGGATQGPVSHEGITADHDVWSTYQSRYADKWPSVIQDGFSGGLTAAELATILSTSIWEDGAQKVVGLKSLTNTTYDGSGQRADGIMNWVSTDDKGSTVAEQMAYIKKRYFNAEPMSNHPSNGSKYKSKYDSQNEAAFKEMSGRSGYTVAEGERYAAKLNSDLLEGSSIFTQWDLAPSKSRTASGLADYVGTAIGAYNWMLQNGYANTTTASDYTVNNALSGTTNGTPADATNNGQGGVGDWTDQEENKQFIWSYLTNELGFTKEGAAGAMGNMEAESEYNPYALYGTHTKDYLLDYAKKVDDTGKFPTNDPYGVVQWLDDRRANLLSHAKGVQTSISDLPMQMEYLASELNGGYTNVRDTMKSASVVQNASDFWQQHFEVCGDGTSRRRNSAQEAYDQFKDWAGGTNTTSAYTATTGANTGQIIATGGVWQVGKGSTALNRNAGQHGYMGADYRAGSRNGLNSFLSTAFGFTGGIYNRVIPTMANSAVGGTATGGLDATTWVNTINMAASAADDAGWHSYHMGANGTIEMNGKTVHGRPDCTGLIQLPLDYLGYDISNIQSDALVSAAASSGGHPIKKDGEYSQDWQSYDWGSGVNADSVQPGDIVARPGHGEIAYGKVGDKFKVWNFGSDDSIIATEKVAKQVLGGTPMETAAADLPTAEHNGSTSAYRILVRPVATALTQGGLNGISTNLPSGPGIRATGVTQTAPARTSVVSGMSNSGLATDMNVPSDQQGRYRNRDGKPSKVTWHTWSGYIGQSPQWLMDCWKSPRECSVNYGIDNNGTIMKDIDEGRGPWTTSSESNDKAAVTFEIENAPGSKESEWEISDAAMQSAINLTVDIAKRNGIPGFYTTFKGNGYKGDGADGTWTYHRTFSDKSCPGDYIFDRTNDILNVVNTAIAGSGDVYDDDIPDIDPSVIAKYTGNTSTNDNLINFSGIVADDEPQQNITNNVIVTRGSRSESDMMEQLVNNTYNVRAVYVESLLEKIIDKMDALIEKANGNGNVKTDKPTKPTSMFPSNEIPSQIQKLAKG